MAGFRQVLNEPELVRLALCVDSPNGVAQRIPSKFEGWQAKGTTDGATLKRDYTFDFVGIEEVTREFWKLSSRERGTVFNRVDFKGKSYTLDDVLVKLSAMHEKLGIEN